MSESIVTLDVREYINSGREPFSLIMSTVSRRTAGEKLLLRVPFEPVPLFNVMANRGFEYETKEQPNGDWEILFSPTGQVTEGPGAPPPCSECPRSSVTKVDARGLEPPEPLVKILEAVSQLSPGHEIHAQTDRRPVHLHAQLEERGLSAESTEQADGSYVTVIRHL